MVASTQLAYDALSDGMKTRIDGLIAIHRYGYRGGDAVTNLSEEQRKRTPDVEHPVVRTHPRTGKKILYVNPGFTMCIKGMTSDESDALLEELFAHQLQPEFRYTHKWSTGQLTIIDNRSSMHCAVDGYQNPMRKLRLLVGCTDQEILAA